MALASDEELVFGLREWVMSMKNEEAIMLSLVQAKLTKAEKKAVAKLAQLKNPIKGKPKKKKVKKIKDIDMFVSQLRHIEGELVVINSQPDVVASQTSKVCLKLWIMS